MDSPEENSSAKLEEENPSLKLGKELSIQYPGVLHLYSKDGESFYAGVVNGKPGPIPTPAKTTLIITSEGALDIVGESGERPNYGGIKLDELNQTIRQTEVDPDYPFESVWEGINYGLYAEESIGVAVYDINNPNSLEYIHDSLKDAHIELKRQRLLAKKKLN